MKKPVRRTTACLIAIILAAAWVGPAGAAGLQPGEYACAGSGGTILIGLGFKLLANGTYTDLNGNTGKPPGRVVYSGTDVTFVGGHLDGQVGHNVQNGTSFEIHSISCSLVK